VEYTKEMACITESSNDNNVTRQKPVLACDVDEVLAYFIPSLARFHNEQFQTTLAPDDFVSYEFHHIWGGTVQECNDKMEMFFVSDFFLNQLSPIPSALDSLRQLAEHFDLQVVTARQNKLKEVTIAWINTHYPGIFTNIHFGNHYSSEGKQRSKSEMCLEINAVALIDDSFSYARDCARAGVPVILFGDYPWNRSHCIKELNSMRELVVRVKDWNEAVVEIHRIVQPGQQ
jgi:uncharacterized HAD superfamily protein